MSTGKEKVVVAMSGGVDSSVAACLLVEQGYDVLGLFMRVGSPGRSTDAEADVASTTGRARQGCCSAGDAADARFVAGMLDIPFFALNFEADFDRIIDYFADEYVRGRTPNPCVVCNDRLKFGKLVDYADAMGARYIATGHYARLARRNDSCGLLRAHDQSKDQTYVLFGLDRRILNRLLFPIGHLLKSEVRDLAAKWNLPNRDKPDSVEICFVPDRDYAKVVRTRRPEAFAEGEVVDASGRVIGRHEGVGHYTVGQRRGLGIAAGKPIYVTRLDASTNTVHVGDGDALLQRTLVAERVNFLVDRIGDDPTAAINQPGTTFRADVKIRYLHRGASATVEVLDRGRIRVAFDEPQRAIAPGQAVVFYAGDAVLGGAWINSPEPEPDAMKPPQETINTDAEQAPCARVNSLIGRMEG